MRFVCDSMALVELPGTPESTEQFSRMTVT